MSALINQVEVGSEVYRVNHSQEKISEQTYRVSSLRALWMIGGPHDGFLDLFLHIEGPGGHKEDRPWYLCRPVDAKDQA